MVIFLVILLSGLSVSLESLFIFSFWYISGVDFVFRLFLLGSLSLMIIFCWLWVKFLYKLNVLFWVVGLELFGELNVIVLLIRVVRFFSFIFVLFRFRLVLMLEIFQKWLFFFIRLVNCCLIRMLIVMFCLLGLIEQLYICLIGILWKQISELLLSELRFGVLR